MYNKNNVCDCDVIHKETVEKVRESLPNEIDMNTVSYFFKILGDNTRVKIMCALAEHEMCVCDLAYLLNMTKSAVSHQLSTLKQAHQVKNRREGKNIYYSLDDAHIVDILNEAFIHTKHQ